MAKFPLVASYSLMVKVSVCEERMGEEKRDVTPRTWVGKSYGRSPKEDRLLPLVRDVGVPGDYSRRNCSSLELAKVLLHQALPQARRRCLTQPSEVRRTAQPLCMSCMQGGERGWLWSAWVDSPFDFRHGSPQVHSLTCEVSPQIFSFAMNEPV